MNKDNPCKEAASEEMANGSLRGHIHEQIEEHFHGHYHGQACFHHPEGSAGPGGHGSPNHESAHHKGHAPENCGQPAAMLVLRPYTGISGDMLLAALASLMFQKLAIDPCSQDADEWLKKLTEDIMPELAGCMGIRSRSVQGISGLCARIDLPESHTHRSLADIMAILDQSRLSPDAKIRARKCFEMLADCEARAHGIAPDNVHFHEIGALDSILDIFAACELYARLGNPQIVCGPLPVADGAAQCAHGVLPLPAPAALSLLEGVMVRPFGAHIEAGELVTPTGIALLRSMDANFGAWPACKIIHTTLVYGKREFKDAPNGLIAALACSPNNIA